jgi:hypothetical protein
MFRYTQHSHREVEHRQPSRLPGLPLTNPQAFQGAITHPNLTLRYNPSSPPINGRKVSTLTPPFSTHPGGALRSKFKSRQARSSSRSAPAPMSKLVARRNTGVTPPSAPLWRQGADKSGTYMT